MTRSGFTTLLLRETIQSGREPLPAGSIQEFPHGEAERLIALGAAVIPPAPLVAPAPAERVTSFSDVGAKFLKVRDAKKAAEFVLDQHDPIALSEITALEYRREGGRRAEVIEAISLVTAELNKPEK